MMAGLEPPTVGLRIAPWEESRRIAVIAETIDKVNECG